jgi:hypothetical protein
LFQTILERIGRLKLAIYDVRMKADCGKTTATTQAVSSHPGKTGHWSQKWRRNTSRAGKKPLADCKKDLQNYGAEIK